MSRKLIYTMTVALPDDVMDQAEAIAKIKPHRDAFAAALSEAGVTGHSHETKIVAAKTSSGKPRKPRAVPAAA